MDPLSKLISLPLVHPSAGLMPVELKDTILTFNRSLRIAGPSTNQIEPLRSNLGEAVVPSQTCILRGPMIMNEVAQEKI